MGLLDYGYLQCSDSTIVLEEKKQDKYTVNIFNVIGYKCRNVVRKICNYSNLACARFSSHKLGYVLPYLMGYGNIYWKPRFVFYALIIVCKNNACCIDFRSQSGGAGCTAFAQRTFVKWESSRRQRS